MAVVAAAKTSGALCAGRKTRLTRGKVTGAKPLSLLRAHHVPFNVAAERVGLTCLLAAIRVLTSRGRVRSKAVALVAARRQTATDVDAARTTWFARERADSKQVRLAHDGLERDQGLHSTAGARVVVATEKAGVGGRALTPLVYGQLRIHAGEATCLEENRAGAGRPPADPYVVVDLIVSEGNASGVGRTIHRRKGGVKHHRGLANHHLGIVAGVGDESNFGLAIGIAGRGIRWLTVLAGLDHVVAANGRGGCGAAGLIDNDANGCLRALIHAIGDVVIVGIGFTRVTNVPDPVAILVRLTRVEIRRAVVAGIGESVVVKIRVRIAGPKPQLQKPKVSQIDGGVAPHIEVLT